MKKDGEKSSSFFVVLFGILVKNDILREYRAAAGVDDRLSPQPSFRVGFEMKENEEKFGNSDFYSYICINKTEVLMIDKKEFFELQVENMTDAEYYSAWNRHCEISNYPDDVIHTMDEFNEMHKDMTPLAILDSVSRTHFNTNDDYFVEDCYSAKSDCSPKYLTEESELVEDMCENPDSFSEFIDEDEYADYICGQFDTTEEYEKFMEWFDENYSGKIYELDFNELLEEYEADSK